MPPDPDAFADMVVMTVRAALGPIVERLALVEQAQKQWAGFIAESAALRDRMTTIEVKADAAATTTAPFMHEIAKLSDRLTAVEVRQPMPGPAGPPGVNGKDGVNGLNGKDGTDGLGWDDMEEVVEDDGRTIRRRYVKGERVKEFVHKTACEVYRGVYVDGKSYERGDGVTWGGSEWHCNEPTTSKPGDGTKAWTLKVKRGRDGKDGRDAPTVPIVKVS